MPAEMAALYAWADEVTRRDLASRREAVELARLRAWTDARRRRASLPDGR